jgi:putative tryptophan/tyrosine transport system substrate-binding protein
MPHTHAWPVWAIVSLVVAAVIGGAILALAPRAGEVPTEKEYTIGILSMRQFNDVVHGFKEEMKKRGYSNVVYREIATNPSPTLAQDIDAATRTLVEENVDAMFVVLEHQAKGAVDVTKELGRTDIPIVFMTRFHDPVEYGIIESFRSSGNNATGVATDLSEIVERSLQFFKDINPNFRTLGVFSDGFMVPGVGEEYFAKLKEKAPEFGVTIREYTTSAPPPQAEVEFRKVAAAIKPGDVDGLFHIPGHFFNLQEAAEGELAVRLKIPMIAPYEDLPNGGIFSYSDDFAASGKEIASIMDKILKGTKPADIPVVYGGNNVLTIMMARARDAGVVFPESMLYIAKNKFEDNSAFEIDSRNR